ncbi:hypothetical protein [Sorangium sp. So ce1151]|uniref:hypothetical protein n=1 Tax=Sorangium sp. So ce1151 TaxID=3133332 RepID=UPI003F601B01
MLRVAELHRSTLRWLGGFFGLDTPASSALTQARFGWKPEQPGLLADLEQGTYFARA